jgi:hypothetical protein
MSWWQSIYQGQYEACTCLYWYVRVCTSTYWSMTWHWQYILVCTGMARQAHTMYSLVPCHGAVYLPRPIWSMYMFVLVCTSMYQYILNNDMALTVYTGIYWYGEASPAWVVSLWRRLSWRKALRAWNKPSVQRRLVGVGKRPEHHQNKACVWLMSIPVRTSTY